MNAISAKNLNAAIPPSDRVEAARGRLDEAGVKFVICNWIDLLGVPKTKPIPVCEFEELCRGKGPQFAVHSVSMVPDLGPADPDQIPMPDLDSLEICPWDKRYAWVVADLYHGEDGAPYHLCPRLALRRQIEKAAEGRLQVHDRLRAGIHGPALSGGRKRRESLRLRAGARQGASRQAPAIRL